MLLYDCVDSYYCQIARLALYEKEAPFELEEIILEPKRMNLEPEFVRMNRQMSIPMLRNGSGHLLTDSRDILEYVESLDGPPLIPEESAEAALVYDFVERIYAIDMTEFAFSHMCQQSRLIRFGAKRKVDEYIRTCKERAEQFPELRGAYLEAVSRYEQRAAEIPTRSGVPTPNPPLLSLGYPGHIARMGVETPSLRKQAQNGIGEFAQLRYLGNFRSYAGLPVRGGAPVSIRRLLKISISKNNSRASLRSAWRGSNLLLVHTHS